MLTGIRWTRVIFAAVLSEAGVIAVLLASIALYGSLIAPGMTDADDPVNRLLERGVLLHERIDLRPSSPPLEGRRSVSSTM